MRKKVIEAATGLVVGISMSVSAFSSPGATVAIKSFSQYYGSLQSATGLPASRTGKAAFYYINNLSRFSKQGMVRELSPTVLIAYAALAGHFCDEWVRRAEQPPAESSMAQYYARAFLGRGATPHEERTLREMARVFKQDPENSELPPGELDFQIAISVCTSFASSVEFIVL